MILGSSRLTAFRRRTTSPISARNPTVNRSKEVSSCGHRSLWFSKNALVPSTRSFGGVSRCGEAVMSNARSVVMRPAAKRGIATSQPSILASALVSDLVVTFALLKVRLWAHAHVVGERLRTSLANHNALVTAFELRSLPSARGIERWPSLRPRRSAERDRSGRSGSASLQSAASRPSGHRSGVRRSWRLPDPTLLFDPPPA